MTAETLLNQLHKVRACGERKWVACCPAHEDKTPSLSVAELRDGRVLVKCFAGCGAAEVVAAVGLSITDLFPEGSLGEYRSFVSLERQIHQRREAKAQDTVDRDRLLLELCDAARKRGERLSRKELLREQEAYLRVRNANRQ